MWGSTLVLSLFIFISNTNSLILNNFTCQGETYAKALLNCPDHGVQRFSSGGNVTVFLKHATNLPNRDSMAGTGFSDPFVRFTFGKSNHKSSSWIDNNLNPTWNEPVSLGILGSGTEIRVDIMDYDMGIEYSSDLLVSTTIRVPFCSMFHASESTYYCETPFNCKVDDSLWQMPTRQLCKESGNIQFSKKACNEKGSICLEVDIYIVPFILEVELYNDAVVTDPLVVSAAGDIYSGAKWTSTSRFGFPYTDSVQDYFDFREAQYNRLEGGLMVQSSQSDKYKGSSTATRFYASTNLPASVYVCRNAADNERGVPLWLSQGWDATNRTVIEMIYKNDPNIIYECWFNLFEGTKKNRWGGITGEYLTFGTNVIGNENDPNFYDDNYVVIAIPRVVVPPYEDLSIYYTSSSFVSNMFEIGLIWAFFCFVTGTFLMKIDFRLDRVESYLIGKLYTGENKHIVATLFFPSIGQSPSNIEYRSHLFHARNIVYFIMTIPFWLLFCWGLVNIATVEPAAVGYGLIFIGPSALLLWSGFRLWERRKWFINSATLLQLIASVTLFICFIISIIFADPSVFKYGHAINLPALSIVFGTINCFPLLLLMFQRDKAYKVNLSVVAERMTEAIVMLKKGLEKGEKPPKASKILAINTALHALLGECYTLNPKVPLFSYSTVLSDIESAKAVDEKKKTGNMLYNIALFILFIYLMIAVSRTDYPSLGFLNCLTLLLFDSIHTSISHGDVEWSAGYHIFLLVAGRLIVTASSPSIWIVHYSAAYLVYSIALIQEMLNGFLPYITKEQAGDVAFAGKEMKTETNPDIAGSPAYCFLTLTFAFVGLILVAAYGNNGSLPITVVDVWGDEWYTYVFGLIAFLVIVTGGLAVATGRAFYLERFGLLKGYARECYLFNPKFRLPMILASMSEISIVCSGILIYGATGSSAVLTSAIFLPPIIGLLGYSCKVWVSNDYDLIVWPPVEKPPIAKDDAPTELEVAYHMMDNMFGDEKKKDDLTLEDFPETVDSPPKERTLKDFALPALDGAGGDSDALPQIKMPALPLKSVLRKKRAQMGIATTATPLVEDLKAREGAEADRFGMADVIDPNDPWAQYEEDDENEEDDLLKSQQIIGKIKKDGVSLAIFNHPIFLKAKAAIMESVAMKMIIHQTKACMSFLRSRAKKYSNVTPGDEEEGQEGEHADDEPIEPKDMPFWTAAFHGYLSKDEYVVLSCWFGGMFLTMIYGIVLSKTTAPVWMGHLVWCSIWMAIMTGVPFVKYFHTYVVDETIILFAKFGAFFHFMFTVCFFGAALEGNADIEASLCILDYFFYYPVFVYVLYEAYKWRDDNWVLIPLDKDGDGNVTWQEYLIFFKAYPIVGAMLILMVFQCYVWVGPITGNVSLLLLLLCGIGYVFARDWSENDFYLSRELTIAGDWVLKFIMFITLLTSLFYPENPIFPVSVFFFTLVFRCCSKIVARAIVADPDTVIFLSPFVFPVYSYDSRKSDIIDETPFAKQVGITLIAGAMWGAFMGMFIYPVSVGITVSCVFLLIIAAIVAAAVSYVPLQLGKLALMIAPEAVAGAANGAVETFDERKKPLTIEIPGWEDDNNSDYAIEKKTVKKSTAIMLANELIDDTRSLRFVHIDNRARMKNLDDEEDIEDMPWHRRFWRKWCEFYETVKKALLPPDKMKDFKRHSEALFSATDMFAEAILTGRGPFGFMGVEGYWYKLFKYAQTSPYLKFLQQPWLNVYDQYGNRTDAVPLAEMMDLPKHLSRLIEEDPALDEAVSEEMRCGIHFLLMVTVAADAKLQREKILFQKFLRENRFRLASNGITPPPEVFQSSSYASIDIALVAVWLSTLTREERERFHMLKTTFSEEQRVRDEAIDSEDFKHSFLATAVLKERAARDLDMYSKINREITVRQNERVRALIDHLSLQERTVFLMHREEWLSNADCIVSPKDQELYDKFRSAVMHCEDESTEYARQVLADIEAGRKDCRIGEYGRNYQFVDSEFLPGDNSIGDSDVRGEIAGWKCAPGICDISQLFLKGTDPDDVEIGKFKTGWVLSALSMLAAAGGIGDGDVDEQILNLFVGHYAIDGQITFATEVGGYCVRIHKNGIWIPVVIDDMFPMLREDEWTNENKGIAGGHSKECQEIWVSLIEKAFAKYYGSYAAIEKGYVHHALQDLTGCEAHCIYLNEASRGSQKRVLWDMMMRYFKNGYIIGAGTGASSLADKGILDMGIVFDAAYTIYDVKYIDGYQLIKLRNPPGDHDEWKGDWGDASKLWTKRLKHKLNWSNENDNTFWMCFDDFCNVFRNLFVCKWYDKRHWIEQNLSGSWFKPVEDASKVKRSKTKRLDFDGVEIEEAEIAEEDTPTLPDTAGGLPSKHNPGCILENNPYFTLRIYRPTDIRLTVRQTDSRGVITHDPCPCAVYVCKSPHRKVALRLKTLNRDLVVAYSGEPQAVREQHIYTSLKPGVYVVLVATYITGMTGNFTLSVQSNYKCKFGQLWPPSWLQEGKSVNANAFLDAQEVGTEIAAVKKIVDIVGKGVSMLLGSGGDKDEDDEGRKPHAGAEEESLEAAQGAELLNMQNGESPV